ncbi:MAG: type II toxin-antitoxin system VapB family antitoxin [Pseudomonadota bacterium]
MSLNIKSSEACELATELCQLTGETKTRAVTEAIRERLERIRCERDTQMRVVKAMVIAGQVARFPRKSRRSHGDVLYGERGMPS